MHLDGWADVNRTACPSAPSVMSSFCVSWCSTLCVYFSPRLVEAGQPSGGQVRQSAAQRFKELSAAIIICVIIVSIQLSHMQLMHLIWPYPASLHSARLWWRWILHQELSGREITLLRVIPTMTFQNSLLTPLLSEAFVTGLLPN